MRKYLFVIIIWACILLVLTGCAQAHFYFTVNKDGSLDLEYRLGMDSSSIPFLDGMENLLNYAEVDLTEAGFIISGYSDNSYKGIRARKHIERIQGAVPHGGTEGLENHAWAIAGPFRHMNFNHDRSFLHNIYTFQGYIDFEETLDDLNLNRITDRLVKRFLSETNAAFILTLPIEPHNHNADEYDRSKGTLVWNLNPQGRNEIFFEIRVINITNIVILIAAAVAAVIGMIVLAKIKGRRQV